MRDEGGYVITGSDLLRDGPPPEGWSLERPPMFVSAVGEGSTAIQVVLST